MKLSSHELARALLARRDNDVKILINGLEVPVGDIVYHVAADQLIIVPDTDSKDYRIAMETDPIPEVERP